MASTVTLSCAQCGSTFSRDRGFHNCALKRNRSGPYCSTRCSRLASRKPLVRLICAYCQSEFSRKQNYRRSKNGKYFCSCLCAAKHNVRDFPMKKPRNLRPCADCGNRVDEFSRKFCSKCWSIRSDKMDNMPKGQCSRRAIASHARSVGIDSTKCKLCGYSKFVERCHKLPVRSFPNTALLREINHPDNLVSLCPNCHWEFDHHLLSPEDIARL
jgi:hypothetical protein